MHEIIERTLFDMLFFLSMTQYFYSNHTIRIQHTFSCLYNNRLAMRSGDIERRKSEREHLMYKLSVRSRRRKTNIVMHDSHNER